MPGLYQVLAAPTLRQASNTQAVPSRACLAAERRLAEEQARRGTMEDWRRERLAVPLRKTASHRFFQDDDTRQTPGASSSTSVWIGAAAAATPAENMTRLVLEKEELELQRALAESLQLVSGPKPAPVVLTKASQGLKQPFCSSSSLDREFSSEVYCDSCCAAAPPGVETELTIDLLGMSVALPEDSTMHASHDLDHLSPSVHAASPMQQFSFLPSVGTWVMQTPLKPRNTM